MYLETFTLGHSYNHTLRTITYESHMCPYITTPTTSPVCAHFTLRRLRGWTRLSDVAGKQTSVGNVYRGPDF